MTNLQKAIDLVFLAQAAVSKSLALDCPDPKFEKYLRNAMDELHFAESALMEFVTSSEIMSLFSPIDSFNSSKK